MWISNQRAWVTQDLFKEWLFKVCAPNMKDYLDTNDLPLKALLLSDNAPGHPADLNPLTGYLPPEKLFRKRFTLILLFPSKMQQTSILSPF
ncbi:hypothetical protein TNCV_243421 [Trichonephila clavipes]|uniref:DDE-1 domain-containing protein n=1 Tax=Trichonephila clavipes TaxID=2585209 RepID=A0A8X6W410_TRICX|nr:hypothetical protein TNCV_243421 [Trichonephila clavipes]